MVFLYYIPSRCDMRNDSRKKAHYNAFSYRVNLFTRCEDSFCNKWMSRLYSLSIQSGYCGASVVRITRISKYAKMNFEWMCSSSTRRSFCDVFSRVIWNLLRFWWVQKLATRSLCIQYANFDSLIIQTWSLEFIHVCPSLSMRYAQFVTQPKEQRLCLKKKVFLILSNLLYGYVNIIIRYSKR